MHIILITLFLLGGCIIYITSQKTNRHKIISIWGGVVLFFYGALRSSSVGIDVAGYVNSYLSIQYMSFREIFTSATMVSRDPVFFFFLKLLTYINKDQQFMLIVISAIVAICVSTFIYKNSVNAIVSFMMFIGLRYYSFTLTGLKQAIAWAIIMLSCDYLKEKKLLKFVLIICVASLFHRAALLFILAYPLAKIKRIDIMSFFALFMLLVNYITNSAIIKLIVKIPIFEQYIDYAAGESTTSGLTLLLIYTCILLFVFILRKQIIKKNNDVYWMYNLTLVGILITFLTFNYANIFRIGYYFIFPIIILFPLAIKSLPDKKLQTILNFVVILLLATQFIIIGPGAGTGNYQFFWQ